MSYVLLFAFLYIYKLFEFVIVIIVVIFYPLRLFTLSDKQTRQLSRDLAFTSVLIFMYFASPSELILSLVFGLLNIVSCTIVSCEAP